MTKKESREGMRILSRVIKKLQYRHLSGLEDQSSNIMLLASLKVAVQIEPYKKDTR